MMDSSQQPSSTPSSHQASGIARRRLVRAGLTAAPVLAALKTNSVLAGDHTCIRPSSFSSLAAAHMKVSQGRVIRSDYECQSHGYWKNKGSGLPSNFKEKTLFLGATGFVANPRDAYSKLSLQDVLELKGNQNNAALARHVVAAYLTATKFNNSSERVLLTKGQCVQIWNGQGNWSPFAGANWNLAQTMAYFDMIYGPAFL
ncbi:hypothetical protein [Hydrogenophaga sp.]|uniref:hypothetical protein n=1 Tax=Hydrogenophaga sp. TaxID=1904254 RepID=UPI002617A07E|nr:hypothetical protein [Hydrogenophaga sp.]MCW5654650.1 hypothetical protein [Hydrogenophaga sp.]